MTTLADSYHYAMLGEQAGQYSDESSAPPAYDTLCITVSHACQVVIRQVTRVEISCHVKFCEVGMRVSGKFYLWQLQGAAWLACIHAASSPAWICTSVESASQGYLSEGHPNLGLAEKPKAAWHTPHARHLVMATCILTVTCRTCSACCLDALQTADGS